MSDRRAPVRSRVVASVDDNGGAHVHGAVDDHGDVNVDVAVNVHVDAGRCP